MNNIKDDVMLTEIQVAELVGLTRRAIQQMRFQNRGPSYVRLSGRCIRYWRSAVLKWLADRTVTPGRNRKKI